MAGSVTVLTPSIESQPIELGRTTWRKQVLPIGSLDYNGRKLNFTKDYIANLVASFKGRAFDAVPFQLADADNKHTNDPTRTAGEVLGLEAAADGLYATVSLTDRGSELVKEHPNLGVSVRIVEQFERGTDGRKFPAALQHVLATWDPRINAMKPWQAVDCSSETDEVIDLSALTFTPDGSAVDQSSVTPDGRDVPVPKERPTVAQLTDEELAAVRSVFPIFQKLAEPVEVTEPAVPTLVEPVEPEFTEAELDAMTAGVDEPESIAASNEDIAALRSEVGALRAEKDAQALQLARVQAKSDESDYNTERDDLARTFGVPPRITDLARPLLMGSGHTVELSGGTSTDAGDIVRKVIREMGTAFGLLNLATPVGTAHELSAAQAQQGEDEAFIAAQHARNGR